MYNLFLDDERIPYSIDPDVLNAYHYDKNPIYKNLEWVVVRTVEEFQECITTLGMPNIISFDNDLQTVLEGYDAIKWLGNEYCIENGLDLPTCYFHSKNSVGYDNMLKYEAFFRKSKINGII
jgi:hypothetical protein